METTGDTTVTVAYEYDALLRLTVEEYTDGKGTLRSEYTYDALGCLVRATVSSGNDVTVSSYTYPTGYNLAFFGTTCVSANNIL